jgi:hypothetical protein
MQNRKTASSRYLQNVADCLLPFWVADRINTGEKRIMESAEKNICHSGGGGLAVASKGILNGRGGRWVSNVGLDSLTDQQKRLVSEYVRNGGNAQAAGDAAGYSRNSVYATMRLPHVREAVQHALDMSIRTEGATLAWGCIRGMLVDAGVPANVRLQAARFTLEHAGLGLAAQAARMGVPMHARPLVDLDEAGLSAFVAAGKAALEGLQTAADSGVGTEVGTEVPDSLLE